MKPYYEQDGIVIYHADCAEVMPELESAAVVLTDPPYNCGKNYGETTNDRQEWPEWCAWFDERLAEMQRCAPNVFSCFSQTAYKHYLRLGSQQPDWSLVWFKPLSMAICAAPFMPHWEPICYWGKQKRTKDGGALWGSDVLTHNVETGKTRWNHPTPKPYSLMSELVSKVTVFGDVVLDPFMGSGTTLRAAKDQGRRAIGIEINEAYCETAAERLSQGVLYFAENSNSDQPKQEAMFA